MQVGVFKEGDRQKFNKTKSFQIKTNNAWL